MSVPLDRCEKAGCTRLWTHLVRLEAADGSIEFHACRSHALEFQEWVATQSTAQGKSWGSVFVEWPRYPAGPRPDQPELFDWPRCPVCGCPINVCHRDGCCGLVRKHPERERP